MNNDDCNRYKVYVDFRKQAARFKKQAEKLSLLKVSKFPAYFKPCTDSFSTLFFTDGCLIK